MALLRRILRISGGLGYTPAAPQWLYRKSHVINPASGAGTGYQIRVTVHYGAGVDSGEHVYLNGKCRTDFGDIRFTGSDGETPLFYWMEKKVDGDHAVFWVKVEEDLSTNPVTIYIYYGNPDATTISDGDATFLGWDDFSEDRYSGPDGKCYVDTTNGWMYMESTSDGIPHYKYRTIGSLPTNFAAHIRYKRLRSDPYGIVCLGVASDLMWWADWSGKDGIAFDIHYGNDRTRPILVENGVKSEPFPETGLDALNTWYRAKLTKFNSLINFYAYDDSWINVRYSRSASFTQTYTLDTMVAFVRHNRVGMKAIVDYVFIRKFVSPEPSHGAWGPEETWPF